MDSAPALAMAVIALFGLLAVGVPVSISLATSGIIGVALINGPDVAGNVIGGTTYTSVGESSLLVIPMFILMGMLTLQSGIASQLFAIASRLLRWLPGGLAMASIFAAAGFGAVSGSSLATVATLGRTSITEMMRHGYARSFAAATVAVSGTLAVLIPPSIILVVYGVITGESVGALLIAGVIPGVFSAFVLALFVCYRAWRKPELVRAALGEESAVDTVPAGASSVRTAAATADGEFSGASVLTAVEEEALAPPSTRVTIASGTHAVLGIAVLFAVVVGGIYTGAFTPTESASIGAFAALVLVCVQFASRPRVLAKNLVNALQDTASMTGMIFLIVVGAGIFSYFLVSAGVPAAISEFALALDAPPLLTVALLLVILIPGGMFLDSMSLLVITTPLLYTPITALGYDGVWLGIIIVTLIELGMITPPVGINVFVTAGTMPTLKVEEIFRAVVPFYVAEALIIATLFFFPILSTWLPAVSSA